MTHDVRSISKISVRVIYSNACVCLAHVLPALDRTLRFDRRSSMHSLGVLATFGQSFLRAVNKATPKLCHRIIYTPIMFVGFLCGELLVVTLGIELSHDIYLLQL